MQSKLFDSELKVMGVLWREGDCTAKHISDVLKQEVGWNMNTTYTLIKRCIGKGAIQRSEPNFLCHALIQKEEVQQLQTDELIDRIYDGSTDKLFAALLGRKKLSAQQIEQLRNIPLPPASTRCCRPNRSLLPTSNRSCPSRPFPLLPPHGKRLS